MSSYSSALHHTEVQLPPALPNRVSHLSLPPNTRDENLRQYLAQAEADKVEIISRLLCCPTTALEAEALEGETEERMMVAQLHN